MSRAILAVALMLAVTAVIGARVRYLNLRAKRLRAGTELLEREERERSAFWAFAERQFAGQPRTTRRPS